jgi:drug/metabolite transporter (DMT)-like permease
MNTSDSVSDFLGPLCALGSSITWASAAAVYTRTAGQIGAMRTNLWRSVIVFPLFVLCAALFYGPRSLLAIPTAQVGWLAMSTMCSYALGDLLFYLAALRIGTATALAIASIYPVWAAASGALFLNEVIGPSRIAGTLCCIGGVIWLVLQQRAATPKTSPGSEAGEAPRPWLSGVLLSLVTSFLWAGNTYAIRRGGVGQPFLAVNAARYFMAVVVLGIIVAVHWRREVSRGRRPALAISRGFFIMVLVEAFGGSSIFVYGLSHSDLSVAAPLSSLAPLFSVPIGLLLGTETLNLRRLTAIIITVTGVILLVR